MIPYTDAMTLLRKHDLHPNIVSHCIGVGEVAFCLALRIVSNCPHLNIDPHKVRMVALLHDIGRCRRGIHEWNSAHVLREEGLAALADIVMHGTLYETFLLRGVTDDRLLPKTIEQKIMNYADLRFCQRPMTLRERLDDALERKRNDPDAVATIRLSEVRLALLEEEILTLAGLGKEVELPVCGVTSSLKQVDRPRSHG